MSRYYNGDINGKFWFAVQSSEAPARFGGLMTIDEYGEHPDKIYFYFDSGDIPDIDRELTFLMDLMTPNIYNKMEAFFAKTDTYNNEKLAEELAVSLPKIRGYLECYADYKLGQEILECVKNTGQCEFTGEL